MEKSIALLLMFIALMLDIAFVKFFLKFGGQYGF